MSQGCFNFRSDDYEPEHHMGPPGHSDVFPELRDLKSKAKSLKAYSRSGRFHLSTKEDLIPIVDPKGYRQIKRLRDFPLPDFPDGLKALRTLSLKRVDRVLNQIRNEVSMSLAKLSSEKERQIYLYEEAEIFIPIGETDSGAFVYAFHCPDNKLSLEDISCGFELYLAHGEKQRRPRDVSHTLKLGAESANSVYVFNDHFAQGINTDQYTPDEQMDVFLNEAEGNED